MLTAGDASFTEIDLTLKSIHNVIEKSCPPGWEFAWVRRRYDGLIRVTAGSAVFTAGEWEHELNAGAILQVRMEDSYRVRAGADGCAISVANYVLDRSGTTAHAAQPRFNRAARSVVYDRLFHDLVRSWTRKGIAYRVECRSTLLAILYNLMYDAAQESLHARGIARIQSALSAIEHGYHTALRVEELARVVGVTPAHFRRIFRAITGQGPKEYILSLRIARAMDFVRSDLYTMSEIAERVGFSSVAHFSRVFHERTGLSPMEYRSGG